ncbi:MAG: glycosyltransferase family 2 protein [Planctomycetota bacterium]|jgi:cellulose synthase/poly-beta-1,6-N-acetylglucosamine synthase-like glycosyltransferase|nr:glycosyltransferase family 2 protein [Planctomycetota bacterium]MDP6762822.1 glycosyltransferase family 2 protein [Planctomycetota bacterium]MDP6990496.1 glycosyltransferase family 2 protein [Planctomycetota bacterium]
MPWLDLLLALATVPSLACALVFATECLIAVCAGGECHLPLARARPPVAVLVPARDEAETIAATVGDLVGQLREGDRLLVVADNCTDETAELARRAGAEVVERTDPEKEGKAHALAFGREVLGALPPRVVIVLDADGRAPTDLVGTLARHVEATGRTVQAEFTSAAGAGGGVRALSVLAILVKNRVRPAALRTLGVPCLLNGSGMAFPWSVFEGLDLGGAGMVEDMRLAVDLALCDEGAVLCDHVRLRSTPPAERAGLLDQRRRWEHGHLDTLVHQVPRLLAAGMFDLRPRLLWFAAHLAVPPLAMLAGLLVICCALALPGPWLWGGSPWPGVAALSGLALLTLGTLVAWARFGRGLVSFTALLATPAYVLWKLPLYLAFLARGPSEAWSAPRPASAAPRAAPGAPGDTPPAERPVSLPEPPAPLPSQEVERDLPASRPLGERDA